MTAKDLQDTLMGFPCEDYEAHDMDSIEALGMCDICGPKAIARAITAVVEESLVGWKAWIFDQRRILKETSRRPSFKAGYLKALENFGQAVDGARKGNS